MDDVKTTWRQRQAAETKRQIVLAARRLFVASGYASTTMEAIADEAGVAVATLYKAFGTKAAIARELNDLIDEEAEVADFLEEIDAESDPRRLIAAVVTRTAAQHERCGDIIAAIYSAAQVDAALGQVWLEGTRRYEAMMGDVVAKLGALGAMRPDVPEAYALGMLSTLCSTETFSRVATRHGWTGEQWKAWTTGALEELLLRRPG